MKKAAITTGNEILIVETINALILVKTSLFTCLWLVLICCRATVTLPSTKDIGLDLVVERRAMTVTLSCPTFQDDDIMTSNEVGR